MEVKLDKGDYSDFTEASKLTLGDIAKRYIDGGYHRKKKGARYEEYRYTQLLDDEISAVNLLRLSSKHLAQYRERRLKEIAIEYHPEIKVTLDTADAIVMAYYLKETNENLNSIS